MNNGITVIANTLRLLRRDQFQIEDFHVVNGCQTSQVLFDQRSKIDDTVAVPLRLIVTENNSIINSIIRATNRQTKIDEEQFFALTDFAEKLEAYFQTFPDARKLYYERRSGQYARLSVPNIRITTHRNLVRSFAAVFLNRPHQTTRNYGALRDLAGKEMFSSNDKMDPYYLSAVAFYQVDIRFRSQAIESKFKAARFHIQQAMRLLISPDQPPRMNSRDMEKYCAPIIEALWDDAAVGDLISRAVAIIERVANENFHRDNIRTVQFTESVMKECGVSPHIIARIPSDAANDEQATKK